MKDNDRIKWCRMGTGYLVKPTPGNIVVPLLARFGMPSTDIFGFHYKGEDFHNLDPSKYKDYQAAFFGVSPDKGLPTRFIFEREGQKALDVWHIIIYWRDTYDSSIQASWSDTQRDYIVTMELGELDTLNPKVAKCLADGLALLLWVQERMSNAGRPKGSGIFAGEGDFLTALKEILSKASTPLNHKCFTFYHTTNYGRRSH